MLQVWEVGAGLGLALLRAAGLVLAWWLLLVCLLLLSRWGWWGCESQGQVTWGWAQGNLYHALRIVLLWGWGRWGAVAGETGGKWP